jgi:hypothetical protein
VTEQVGGLIFAGLVSKSSVILGSEIWRVEFEMGGKKILW